MCEKDHGRSMDKPHRPWQSPAWLGTKWCYVYAWPPGKTIDSDLYCQQLMKLKKYIERNWPELVKNWESLAGMRWCILPIALTLLHQISTYLGHCHSLGSIKLTSKGQCEPYLSDLFKLKISKFLQEWYYP